MRIEKVYFPKWVAWFIILILLPILLVLEYESFYGGRTFPLIGAAIGFIFIMLIVMSFLVSYRRIPYMIIEKQSKTRRGR
jgi:hypothetical protein